MWKKVMAPTVLLTLLWVLVGGATIYYVNWLYHGHARELAENLTTIQASEAMQDVLWRLQASVLEVAELADGHTRLEVAEWETAFETHLTEAERTTVTPEERTLVSHHSHPVRAVPEVHPPPPGPGGDRSRVGSPNHPGDRTSGPRSRRFLPTSAGDRQAARRPLDRPTESVASRVQPRPGVAVPGGAGRGDPVRAGNCPSAPPLDDADQHPLAGCGRRFGARGGSRRNASFERSAGTATARATGVGPDQAGGRRTPASPSGDTGRRPVGRGRGVGCRRGSRTPQSAHGGQAADPGRRQASRRPSPERSATECHPGTNHPHGEDDPRAVGLCPATGDAPSAS